MGSCKVMGFVVITVLLVVYTFIARIDCQLPYTLDLSWFQESEDWKLAEPIQYSFQEFQYIQTRRSEALYREYWVACEQNPSCWSVDPNTISHASCVRQCMNSDCYT